jgi:hypothetical protein
MDTYDDCYKPLSFLRVYSDPPNHPQGTARAERRARSVGCSDAFDLPRVRAYMATALVVQDVLPRVLSFP